MKQTKRMMVVAIITGALIAVVAPSAGAESTIGAVADGDAVTPWGDSQELKDNDGNTARTPPVATSPSVPADEDETPEECIEYFEGLKGWVNMCGDGFPGIYMPGNPPETTPDEQQDPAGSEPVVLTAQEFQRLPIDPGVLQVQPATGWVLLNVQTIAFSGATEQVLSTTVLDRPVRVRVQPVDFTWDFGDGSPPLITTDAGAPYPEHTVAHAYTAVAQARQITVTTRWSGHFEVDGSGTWQPVAGMATTTQVSPPFQVRQARTALVANN